MLTYVDKWIYLLNDTNNYRGKSVLPNDYRLKTRLSGALFTFCIKLKSFRSLCCAYGPESISLSYSKLTVLLNFTGEPNSKLRVFVIVIGASWTDVIWLVLSWRLVCDKLRRRRFKSVDAFNSFCFTVAEHWSLPRLSSKVRVGCCFIASASFESALSIP